MERKHAQTLIHATLPGVRHLVLDEGQVGTGLCRLLELVLTGAGLDVDAYTEYVEPELEALMASWPKYSGDRGFPVPHTPECGYASPRSAYYVARNARTLWDRSTEYGQLRWELLEYLDATLTSELEKEQQEGGID